MYFDQSWNRKSGRTILKNKMISRTVYMCYEYSAASHVVSCDIKNCDCILSSSIRTFFASNWIFFLPDFFLIHFGAKKVFFLSICGCWSNWWKKCCVHCGTSCKIRTPTDKNCGNESKIRLTHKIRRFMPTFLPPGFLTKKHAKMGTFLNAFFSLFVHV